MSCELTYEQLAAYAAGDLDDAERDSMARHVDGCDDCRRRLAAIERADGALAALPRREPTASAILAVRRAVSNVTRGGGEPEIMTLDEVADFLRISPKELGQIAEELPAFELAGRVRVRRSRLVEWVQKRERDYTRHTAASWAARARRRGPAIDVA